MGAFLGGHDVCLSGPSLSVSLYRRLPVWRPREAQHPPFWGVPGPGKGGVHKRAKCVIWVRRRVRRRGPPDPSRGVILRNFVLGGLWASGPFWGRNCVEFCFGGPVGLRTPRWGVILRNFVLGASGPLEGRNFAEFCLGWLLGRRTPWGCLESVLSLS